MQCINKLYLSLLYEKKFLVIKDSVTRDLTKELKEYWQDTSSPWIIYFYSLFLNLWVHTSRLIKYYPGTQWNYYLPSQGWYKICRIQLTWYKWRKRCTTLVSLSSVNIKENLNPSHGSAMWLAKVVCDYLNYHECITCYAVVSISGDDDDDFSMPCY